MTVNGSLATDFHKAHLVPIESFEILQIKILIKFRKNVQEAFMTFPYLFLDKLYCPSTCSEFVTSGKEILEIIKDFPPLFPTICTYVSLISVCSVSSLTKE